MAISDRRTRRPANEFLSEVNGGFFRNHPDYVAFGRVQQKPLGAALTENDVRFGKIDRRKEAMVTACFYDACGVPDVESFGAQIGRAHV